MPPPSPPLLCDITAKQSEQNKSTLAVISQKAETFEGIRDFRVA